MDHACLSPRRLVARAITLGIVATLVTQMALPAVVAARESHAGPAVAAVEGHGSHHDTAKHHHPGCPWRGKGPCPHQGSGPAHGPAFSACAEIPAATATTAGPLLAGVPELDWSLTPTEAGQPAVFRRADPCGSSATPEPPPPRLLRSR